MQQMSVNDMFLDEDGIEGSKVKYYQHTDVVDKVEVQNSSQHGPIKIPIFKSYPKLVESRGIDEYIGQVNN